MLIQSPSFTSPPNLRSFLQDEINGKLTPQWNINGSNYMWLEIYVWLRGVPSHQSMTRILEKQS